MPLALQLLALQVLALQVLALRVASGLAGRLAAGRAPVVGEAFGRNAKAPAGRQVAVMDGSGPSQLRPLPPPPLTARDVKLQLQLQLQQGPAIRGASLQLPGPESAAELLCSVGVRGCQRIGPKFRRRLSLPAATSRQTLCGLCRDQLRLCFEE